MGLRSVTLNVRRTYNRLVEEEQRRARSFSGAARSTTAPSGYPALGPAREAAPAITTEDWFWGRVGTTGTEEDYFWRRLSDNWTQKDVLPATYLEIHNQVYEAYNGLVPSPFQVVEHEGELFLDLKPFFDYELREDALPESVAIGVSLQNGCKRPRNHEKRRSRWLIEFACSVLTRWLYVSIVIVTLLCPKASCTIFGWTLSINASVAYVCLVSLILRRLIPALSQARSNFR